MARWFPLFMVIVLVLSVASARVVPGVAEVTVSFHSGAPRAAEKAGDAVGEGDRKNFIAFGGIGAVAGMGGAAGLGGGLLPGLGGGIGKYGGIGGGAGIGGVVGVIPVGGLPGGLPGGIPGGLPGGIPGGFHGSAGGNPVNPLPVAHGGGPVSSPSSGGLPLP